MSRKPVPSVGPWQPQDGTRPTTTTRNTPERRRGVSDPTSLRAGLTPAQLNTLEALEIFKWRLAVVRRPLVQPPIPVLFDADNTRYVVIMEDGTLDEHPTLKLRD